MILFNTYLSFAIFLSALFVHDAICADLPIVGWNEDVTFYVGPGNQAVSLELKAKIDTGAKTSSLHAIVNSEFQKNGQTFVKFTTHSQGKRLELEAPLAKTNIVKTSDSEEGESRYFVTLDVCLGNTLFPVVVSLNERTKMAYPALLGRAFLNDHFLVNPGKAKLQGKPSCKRNS